MDNTINNARKIKAPPKYKESYDMYLEGMDKTN